MKILLNMARISPQSAQRYDYSTEG